MRRRKVDLGGEQSGHILMLNKSKAGDGILSGLQLASLLVRSGKSLAELAQGFPEYPQQLTNLTVHDKQQCLSDKRLAGRIDRVKASYADVRFYLRPSGTENVVRVLTESASLERCRAANDAVCQLIRQWDRG
jgi:phosphoglucosamine mutase